MDKENDMETCPAWQPWSKCFIVDDCLHYGTFTGKCWLTESWYYDKPCPWKGKREQSR